MLAATLMLTCACQAFAQMAKSLEVKELTLSNGMTVWLNEDHSQPKVYGAVVVNAGAKDSPNTGIAHYFEHIMFKGTEEIGTTDYAQEKLWLDSIAACYDRLAATNDEAARKDIQHDINRLSMKAGEYAIPNEFSNLITRYGGSSLNAGTSYDFTFYHNVFTPQYLEHWCLLNSDRLIKPVFRMFQGELETVYEEKNMYDDNIKSKILDTVMKELFGTNGYAYPVIGSTENLKNPRLSEMKAFYEKFYVGCNMGLVLAGDIDAENVMPLLERTFGRIPRGVKPVRTASPLPDIFMERTVTVPIPVPLVSIEMLAFKAPTDYEKDANAINIASKLLSNGNAGMLDSLMNEGNLMAALMMPVALNDAGLDLMIIVPNLLSKTEKAENACLAQLKRVSKGDFSNDAFIAQKQEAYREALLELEEVEDRALKMVNVMSSGHRWQEYIDKVNAIDKVTRDDVIAVAKRYFEKPFVRFKKKYGNPEKDKVSQPDYTPIIPKNKNTESEYAQRLAELPVADTEPRLLDFEHDATTIPLGGQATLYTVKNQVNDLFELTISYNRGKKADPRMQMATELANSIGTDSLTRQQLGTALQHLGANMAFDCDNNETKIEVTGVDKNFEETMKLVRHFLQHAKSNEKSLKQVKDGVKAEEKSLTKENTDVMRALLQKVAYGQKSPNLNRLTYKEAKTMNGEELLEALSAMQTTACDIVYSGTLDNSLVERVVRASLPIERSQTPYVDYSSDNLGYNVPVVYFFDMPKARQTLFFTYDQLRPIPAKVGRVPANLMNEYFGGGMSSVLFQEVREFRSMAYSSGSTLMSRPRLLNPNSPLAFICVVGTQGDKTQSALSLVDSLLRDMPIVEKNFEIARQSCINDINNAFPSFRKVGAVIADQRRKGFNEDSRTGLAYLYGVATPDDLKRFYDHNIKNNTQHRVWGVVGNKKKVNVKELEKYGRVVVVKERDLFRK